MNRITALLLAMAALLAHALAMHLDEIGAFGHPYEVAHQAYHLARNLVREGELAWNVAASGPAAGGLEAYPSPLWVAVAAVAERLYLPVNFFTQLVGLAAALLTIVFSARFEENRIAGVIPALLLVTCGSFAAPSVSGTEVPVVALLFTASFVAFENRRRILFALALGLLVLARPEGVLVAVVFAVLGLADRATARHGAMTARLAAWTFLPAGAATLALVWERGGHGRSLYGTWIASIVTPDATRIASGLAYVYDLVVTSVTPVLLVFPLVALLAGKLSGTGRRALGLGSTWVAIVTLEGGGPQPFTLALAPALPLLFIAVQQGIVAALDSGRKSLERLSWASLLLGALVGAFASKFPGDLGPLNLRPLHARWMESAAAPPPYGGTGLRGRTALGAEILRTAELRDLALFLRDEVDSRLSILTAWPGAIGYLSQMQVLDLFGRVTVPPGAEPNSPWPERPRADLVAALRQEADFVLPGMLGLQGNGGGPLGLGIEEELIGMDLDPGDPDRRDAILEMLTEYELVTLPVVQERLEHFGGPPRAFQLLRRRALGIAPVLDVGLEEGALRVDVLADPGGPEGGVSGHPQIARLEIRVEDGRGHRWCVSPSGAMVDDDTVFARTDLRLEPGIERPVRLFEGPLGTTPAGTSVVAVHARLYNPVVSKQHVMAPASEGVTLRLR